MKIKITANMLRNARLIETHAMAIMVEMERQLWKSRLQGDLDEEAKQAVGEKMVETLNACLGPAFSFWVDGNTLGVCPTCVPKKCKCGVSDETWNTYFEKAKP